MVALSACRGGCTFDCESLREVGREPGRDRGGAGARAWPEASGWWCSLASFAGCGGRAWPGAAAAAARAGLSRNLHDRDRLVRRGSLIVEEVASGRGRASTFAAAGPWWEAETNAELFKAVLSGTRTRGPARLLLAAPRCSSELKSGSALDISPLFTRALERDRAEHQGRSDKRAGPERLVEHGRAHYGADNWCDVGIGTAQRRRRAGRSRRV